MTPGEKFADRFVIERRVGAGGMGAVHLARDERSGALVALKTLTLSGDAARARFAREAQTLAALEHPNIVGYVAHGLPLEGTPWLAMEWLDGCAPDDLELSVADVLRVIRGAARGLAAAHARGVIHRDIKPSNLLLVSGDPERVKLLDFGIARGGLEGDAAITLTATGETIGTPHFMAPEQARGAKELDARVDVYSLGAVLYQLLAGRPPLEGQSALAVLAKILLEDPPPIDELVADLPADLGALVHHMLARDPRLRLADARAVLAALDTLRPVAGAELRRRHLRPVALGEAERRLACVVLVGADPGAEAAMLAPTLASEAGLDPRAPMVEVVRQHGGHAELLGDGALVATFPTELPTDQAQRAARCALALRGVVAGKPIAVVAGQSLLSSVVPLGEALDRGALLLVGREATARGEAAHVLVDAVIEGLLGPRFECRALAGDRFELVDVHVDRAASRRLLGVEVPCVGRRRELEGLAALFRESAEESVARALVVVGGAGSGKTRLLREACAAHERAPRAGSARPLRWEGRADATRGGAPYGLMGDLLRRAAGLREADPVAVKQLKLAQFLGRFLSGAALQNALFFLAEMVRAPFPNEASEVLAAARTDVTSMSDAIRGAALQLLRAATQQGPLVLVLDDFQHGDHPSRELLHHALRQLESAPLVVVAVGRPELEAMAPALWADAHPQVLRLTKLTKRASEDLVSGVLAQVAGAGRGAISREVVASIVERADGNPFFLEEMLRSALEKPQQALPETVLAMLQARFASLDTDARRVLRAASVFGVRFWGGAVGRLLGRSDAPDATLEHLAEQELIELVDERDVPAEWTWRFRQELTREAAYATLTAEDRTLGHQLAGEWLLEQGIDDPLTLAAHHQGAGEPLRAGAALVQAAERALEAGDHHAAVELVARALALVGAAAQEPSDAERQRMQARLRLVAAEAHRWLGAYAASLAHVREALPALPRGHEAYFRALGCCIVAAGQSGAIDELDAALRELIHTPAVDEAAALLRLIALCRGAHQRLGQRRLQDADALLALAHTLAAQLGVDGPVVAAWLHTTFAARAHVAGDWVAYVRESERAVQAYDQARDLRHACNQRVRLGYGLVEVGEFARAVDVLRRAVDDSAELGVPLIEGFALQNLGLAQLRHGDLQLAHATLRNAEARGAEHGHASVVAGACYYLTEVLLALGQVEQAERCADAAAAGFAGSPFHRGLALAGQARVCLARAHVQQALALVERAAVDRVPVAVAESSDAIVDVTLAEARRAAGDVTGAAVAVRSGLERLEIYLAAVPDASARERMRACVPAHVALRTLARELAV
ncbi:MAG: protein kinase [Sandaracinaceae bacterium]|nr:protein kinase [Sandaracinaceae bacterium]